MNKIFYNGKQWMAYPMPEKPKASDYLLGNFEETLDHSSFAGRERTSKEPDRRTNTDSGRNAVRQLARNGI